MLDYFSQAVDKEFKVQMPSLDLHLDEALSQRSKGVSSQYLVYLGQGLRVRMILDKKEVLVDVASPTEPDTWFDLSWLSVVGEVRGYGPRWNYSMTRSPRLAAQVQLLVRHPANMHSFLIEAFRPAAFPGTKKEYIAAQSKTM